MRIDRVEAAADRPELSVLARFAASSRARWAIVWLAMAALAAVRSATPDERDPYWSARAGADTLAGEPLARPDTWSWSQPGGIWVQNSPGWNVLLGWSWQTAGFWGLFVLTFVSIMALFAVTWTLAVKLGARPLPGLAGLLVGIFAAFPMLSARATVPVQTLLLAAVLLGWWAGPKLASIRTVAAAGLVAAAGFTISVAGNWIHLSFILLWAAVAGMWAIQWWTVRGATTGWKVSLTVAGFAGSAAGALLSPYGIVETLRQSQATKAICEGLIAEWASPWQVQPRWVAAGLLALAVGFVAVWWLWRNRRSWDSGRFRLVAPLAAVGLPTAAVGMLALRFIGMSLLTMLALFAWGSTMLVNRLQRSARTRSGGVWASQRAKDYTTAAVWMPVLSISLTLTAPFAAAAISTGARPPEQAVVAQLPAGCRLFASQGVSGVTILTRPDVNIWIDGRADYFGRRHLLDNYRIMAGVAAVPDGTTCVILGTPDLKQGYRGAWSRIDQDPAWRRAATKNDYILWLPATPN